MDGQILVKLQIPHVRNKALIESENVKKDYINTLHGAHF